MVNPPMVKGYNVNHLLTLPTPIRTHLFSALIPHFPAPGSMARSKTPILGIECSYCGHRQKRMVGTIMSKQKIPISRINFLFSEKKRNFADGQLAQTGWRVDLHYGKGRLLT